MMETKSVKQHTEMQQAKIRVELKKIMKMISANDLENAYTRLTLLQDMIKREIIFSDIFIGNLASEIFWCGYHIKMFHDDSVKRISFSKFGWGLSMHISRTKDYYSADYSLIKSGELLKYDLKLKER